MLQPAPVQSAYTRYLLPAQNGMLASAVNWVADSKIVETAAGIGFGLAVSQGALSDDGIIIGGSAFVGITRADITLPRSETLTLDTYARYDNASVLSMGDLWVNCYASVAVGAVVTFEAATGKLGIAGTTITHARWMTTAVGSAGTPALAVVRLGDISNK